MGPRKYAPIRMGSRDSTQEWAPENNLTQEWGSSDSTPRNRALESMLPQEWGVGILPQEWVIESMLPQEWVLESMLPQEWVLGNILPRNGEKELGSPAIGSSSGG